MDKIQVDAWRRRCGCVVYIRRDIDSCSISFCVDHSVKVDKEPLHELSSICYSIFYGMGEKPTKEEVDDVMKRANATMAKMEIL